MSEAHTQTTLDQNDIEEIKSTLFGRSVTHVQYGGDLPNPSRYRRSEGKLTLDDGTELLLGGNDGGCSCGAGDYTLTQLNDMPINGITNVELAVDQRDQYGEALTYRIFVLAHDQRFELATFEGDDGNGYYGTGFWITVRHPQTSAP